MMPGSGVMGWGWSGMGAVGWLFMFLFWGLIIIGLVLVVRWLLDRGRPGVGQGAGEAPLDILKRRYARGEIGKDEYDRMKRDLT